MSISSSLNAGVTGLASNASRLAAISDNIANSGTYGYKRAAAEFESMVITGAAGGGIGRQLAGHARQWRQGHYLDTHAGPGTGPGRARPQALMRPLGSRDGARP